jgi:4-hydroxy-tetrahydrodipicolinate reductase
MSIRIGITGAAGRMGRMLAEVVSEAERPCSLVVAIEHAESSLLGADMGELLGDGASGVTITSDLAAVLSDIDVLIDFTVPEATLHHATLCAEEDVPMVIGTTGFSDTQMTQLLEATRELPVCQASNFSPGVNLTFDLVKAAAEALGDSADIEIVEAHHRHKIDAPSGTALSLGEVIADALGRDLSQVAVYGREGRTGERSRETIGFSTIRAGDIVGDHTVIFAGDGERLEITHRASSRTAFANGAVRAACWLSGQKAGRYSMQDVLRQETNPL